MKKYCENGVFVNPDYVEELFSQLTTVDQEKLLSKLCNCYDLRQAAFSDWQDALDSISVEEIVEYIGEDEILYSIDDFYIKNYVENNDIMD
jgi:hypothetical protein